MEYVGTSETQFYFSYSDVQIMHRHISDGEPAALIATYLLELKSIGEFKFTGENILKVKNAYQKIKTKFIDSYQKYKSVYSLSANGRQPLLLADCTQDDITKAYKNQDTAFLVQLCEGILNSPLTYLEDSLYFMGDNPDSEDSKHSLIRALYEKGPQDLHQLENRTGLDKTSIDNCLRELENEGTVVSRYDEKELELEDGGIVFSRHDDKKISAGVFIQRRVYYLPPL